jgi:hypothetical protein
MHAIRNARAQQSRMLSRAVRTTDAHAFFNLLTDDSMLDQVEVQLPMHRERLLPPTETLAMFLALPAGSQAVYPPAARPPAPTVEHANDYPRKWFATSFARRVER